MKHRNADIGIGDLLQSVENLWFSNKEMTFVIHFPLNLVASTHQGRVETKQSHLFIANLSSVDARVGTMLLADIAFHKLIVCFKRPQKVVTFLIVREPFLDLFL